MMTHVSFALWFLASVVSDVSSEAVGRQERLSADVTAVCFLMTVKVTPQVLKRSLQMFSTKPFGFVHVTPGELDQKVCGAA